MALRLNCPGCDTALNVAETLVGKTIKCKTCGEMIPVTAPAKAAVARRAAAVVDDEDDAPVATGRRKWDDGDDDAPVAVKSSGGSKGLMIAGIAAGLLLLLGGGMAGAYFFFAPASDDGKAVASAPMPDVTTPNRQSDAGNPTPPTPEEKKPEAKKPEETKPVTNEKTAGNTDEQKASGTPPKKEDKPKPAEPVTPKVETQPPVTASAGQTSEEYNRKMMSGELDAITLDQVKRATVMIECESKFGGKGTGSGWFGIENNIVITNAHVIDMIAPGSPPPAKLTIFVNSGERGQTPGLMQRDIPHQRIKILAVDRFHDIAILEISGEKDLPVPFKVRPTAKMKERQGLSVVGFPLGYIPGAATGSRKQPTVSLRQSSVSALRYDDFGILRNLQIQGGTSPGNSGGPQVDAEGYVIGMTVSHLVRDTSIAMSVPTEHIQGLLAGRIDEVQVDTAINRDGMVNIPIRVTAQDPMKRLKSIGVGYWVGESSGGIRPPGEMRKGITAADKDYKEIDLKYDPATKEAKGSLVLAPLTPGQSYWIQPFYANAIIPKYYLPGTKVDLKGPPVDPVPVTLQVNLRSGQTRPFTLIRSSAQDEFAEGEGSDPESRVKFVTTMKGTESILAPDANDTQSAARLRLKYDDADIKVDVQNQEMQVMPPRILQQFKQGIKQLEAFAYVNRQGGIYRTRTNLLAVNDPLVRQLGPAVSSNVLGSLTECSIPMPNKEVQPNESWGSSRTIQLSLSFLDLVRQNTQGGGGRPQRGGPPRPGGGGATPPGGTDQVEEVGRRDYTYTQEVKFTYQGTRIRGGRNEAVIKVEGKVTPAAGKGKDSASGQTKGYAFVDVATGIVMDAEIESEFELDTSIQGLKQRSHSINKYNLSRGGNVK